MPSAPPHTCPKCGQIVTGKCKTCEGKRDAARGSAFERGYDREWAEYSRARLQRFPWCGQRDDGLFYTEHSQCARLGLKVRATVTDHICAMKAGGSKFETSNHQSLCGGCNRRKAIEHEGAFRS